LREKLLALVALQKVDMEIAALNKSAGEYPKQIAELEQELGQARSATEAERSKLTDLDRQKSTMEQTIIEEKDKVKKWEARLTEQRSTREYSALAREIDIAKKTNLTMAEDLIELGKAQALQRTAFQVKEAEFLVHAKELGEKMGALRAKLAAVEAEVTGIGGRREEAARKVDSTLIKRYEHIKKKKLPAMVAVVAPGTCNGCRMNVPAQMYNTLRTTLGYDLCPSCQRIIHAAEALEG
jgi:predicted  nucleic acid-binding Zn-ribbon protein